MERGFANSSDIPRKPELSLDIELLQNGDRQNIARNILKLIQVLLAIWTNLTVDDIQVERVNTAMTNFVYAVTSTLRMSTISFEDSGSTSHEPEKLLLRVYGKSNWMFEREIEEAAAMTLSSAGLIPRWYGIFGNGRFEDFIPSVPVSASEFRTPAVFQKVIPRVSNIHSLLPEILLATGWEKRDYLWDRLDIWLRAAEAAFEELLLSGNKGDILSRIKSWGVLDHGLLRDLQSEMLHYDSPVIHHGNLLQLLSDGDIVVIDFEYGMPTSRGFDLANYLSEFCSDYDSATPELVNKSQFPSVKDIDQILTLYSSSCDAEKIESLRKEVLAHLPLVYLHWGHWGLVKAAESGGKSSFDYLTYSLQRYQQYIDFKTLLSPYINEKQ